MRSSTHTLTFALAIMLSLTSMISGPMRAGSAMGEVVVICTTQGLTQIMIGPDGQKVTPHPHCPDCVLLDLVSPSFCDLHGGPPPVAKSAFFRIAADPALFEIAQWCDARAPPVLSF